MALIKPELTELPSVVEKALHDRSLYTNDHAADIAAIAHAITSHLVEVLDDIEDGYHSKMVLPDGFETLYDVRKAFGIIEPDGD